MSETNRGGVAIAGVVLLAAAVGGFLYLREARERPAPAPAVVSAPIEAPAEAVEAPSAPSHPIEDAIVGAPAVGAESPALPSLPDSDAAAIQALLDLLEGDRIPAWLVPEYVIQRTVATIDNLPRAKIASNISVARATPGALAIEGEGETRTLSAANHARYAAQVDAFESADTAALVAGYVRLYPLFQQAYRELGGPDAHFNDRLVEVIDHLLAAPPAAQPVELVRVRAYWQFRDPALEAMSAGHKLMVRIGPAQAERVKVKLRALREAVAGIPAPAVDATVSPPSVNDRLAPPG